MLRTVLDKAQGFRHRLTRLDDQPLGRAALVVIIFLDVFILGSIFDGLADHTRQMTTPEERVPALCREVVIDGRWNATNRLDKLAQGVTRFQDSVHTPYAQSDEVRWHPACAPILGAHAEIRDDAALARQLKSLVQLRRETRDLRAEIEPAKGAYDTRLLERMAGQTPAGAETEAMRRGLAEKTATLDARLEQERTLAAAIEQNPRVAGLFALATGISEAQRTALRDELRRMNFWFPVERLAMQMLFLLPLLAVFWFWNSRSLAAGRPFQTLVSSHLLVVAAIPVLLKVAELVYDIIPRRLLRQLIELLESLHLVALWHYLMIALAIAGALALIYLFQKKLFSQEKLLQRRIAKGQCQACGLQLPPGSRHCPACGAAQYRTCRQCGTSTLVHGRFCTHCGLAGADDESPEPFPRSPS